MGNFGQFWAVSGSFGQFWAGLARNLRHSARKPTLLADIVATTVFCATGTTRVVLLDDD